MWVIFQLTFSLGQYPMDWIESLVQWFGKIVGNYMPAGILKDCIVDGIIAGVGGVIIFLPNILILYFFISYMEDSGYMSRAAFVQVVHTDDNGIWLQCAGDNVNEDHRKQTFTNDNVADNPVHELFGTAAGLSAVCRSLFPGQ